MTDKESFAAARTRAYELADTGRYEDWTGLSADLLAEGFSDRFVKSLAGDSFTQTMLRNRMAQARDRN